MEPLKQTKIRAAHWLFAALLISCSLLTASAEQGAAQLQSDRALDDGSVREISLNGNWDAGIDRHYDRMLRVPGLATDPSHPTPGTLWYKRTVTVPAGSWTHATLTLKGARFAPQIYVDGKLVSSAEGGMAATMHRFVLPAGGGARSFTLEIALHSLTGLDPQDASAVPAPDLWRSNVSSYLWDSVVLRLHGDGAERGDDHSIIDKLRQRVKLIVEDAPVLAGTVNPNASITITNIGALYGQRNMAGAAESLTPLAEAGKSLSRTPVVRLSFGTGSGNLIVSQLLTAGRLLPDHAESGPGVYGLRYDPVAVQFVLNMLAASLDANELQPH